MKIERPIYMQQLIDSKDNAAFNRVRQRNTGGPVASPGNLPCTSGHDITKPRTFASTVVEAQKVDAVVALLRQLMEGKICKRLLCHC